jgi:hypothetical protein
MAFTWPKTKPGDLIRSIGLQKLLIGDASAYLQHTIHFEPHMNVLCKIQLAWHTSIKLS